MSESLSVAVAGDGALAQIIPFHGVDRSRTAAPVGQADRASSLHAAERLLRAHKRRAAILGANADLFGDPAWFILLDLYVAARRNKPVSVSKACIAAEIPATTGLRLLERLAERGLIVREPDAYDRRRFNVSLSITATFLLEQFLAEDHVTI